MRQFLLAFLLVFLTVSITAQPIIPAEGPVDTTWKDDYRGAHPIINDLIHTKLDVRFDFDKQWLYGKEWLTVQPKFYTIDSLVLDAKFMDIKEVALVNGKKHIPLKYSYDSLKLRIQLDKKYKGGEDYTVYIQYISKPNEAKVEGSAAITDAKGLYFINPTGKGEWPTQIWTQGETEANSVWMPTIDKPDQKTTQEISMTVPSKYVTLSNGLLVSQKKNNDGTRTDTWKLDLPNAPYLFFMGVGDFAIVKDYYKKMPVTYYVEPQYESVARELFGETPEMIAFFSDILNVPYAWPKYAQMVGREYVSGAMENTTATLHGDGAYQNARELVDGNTWERVIAHELFHHWFGDLVTTESWSNITVNESFANYSEYLWEEYRHGEDAADEANFDDMRGYLFSNSDEKDLVRFYYPDEMVMFDAVSYNKGGRILHMLRNYVGDSAFFHSLHAYLMENKFQPAEAQQLRLAFEEVTGLDLNWFWNQWYYGSGHPSLDIHYNYVDGQQQVIVNQVQESGKLFRLPVAIDVYSQPDEKTRYWVWVQGASDTFYFPSAQKPSWVNVDAQKVLLCTKTDNKPAEDFVLQYQYGPKYLDRREALNYFAKNKDAHLALGLKDKYEGLRLLTLNLLDRSKMLQLPGVIETIEMMAKNEPDKKTQAKALEILADQQNEKYLELFQQHVNDSSYSVAGAALLGISNLKPDKGLELARGFSKDARGKLGDAVSGILYKNGEAADFETLLNILQHAPLSNEKLMMAMKFGMYLSKLDNAAYVKQGVDAIIEVRNSFPGMYHQQIDPAFKRIFNAISSAQTKSGKTELADYINHLLD